jgi:hypothetical protein
MRGLKQLRSVRTEVYTLCCPQILPPDFNVNNCLSPQPLLSSCDTLLGSVLHRVVVAVLAALAVCCNVAVLAWSFLATTRSERKSAASDVFLTHLAVSDLLMGMYLASISLVDRVHDGTYLTHQEAWQDSGMCAALAVISVTAHNVSAAMVCWTTLDRCLTACTRRRVSLRATHAVCIMTWTVSVLLSGVPLLPATSPWQLYSRSGLGLPLPVSTLFMSIDGHSFSVAVTVGVSGVLLLCVLVGCILIFMKLPTQFDLIRASVGFSSVQAKPDVIAPAEPVVLDTPPSPPSNPSSSLLLHDVTQSDSDQQKQLTNTPGSSFLRDASKSRRLLLLTSINVLLWLPVCLWVVLQRVPGWQQASGPAQMTLLLLLLPLRSALNPLLLWLGVVQERGRQEQRGRLMKWLGVSAVTGRGMAAP